MTFQRFYKFATPKEVTIPESRDDQTLTWVTHPDWEDKVRFVDEQTKDGHCYLRLIFYYCDFASLPTDHFYSAVLAYKTLSGRFPDSFDCINNLNLLWYDTFVKTVGMPTDEDFGKLQKRIRVSKIRLEFDVEGDLVHVKRTGLRPMCECSGPVCQHGWDHRMATTVLGTMNRKVGASGFNMMDFLQGAMTGEEDFEEAYSQLNPDSEEVEASKEVVKEWRVDSESQAPDKQTQDTLTELRLLREEVNNLKGKQPVKQTPQPLSPPTSPRPLRPKQATLMSLTPNDSSSVYSRYDRRFMEEGTVLTVGQSLTKAEQVDRRTNLTVSNSLVEGFKKTQELAEDEQQVLRRLRPINGLPRPFADSRLNFLANIHTAITRAKQKRPDSYVSAMNYVLRSRPELPVDDLLYQVLSVTIDRSTGIFVSNAFVLPYIEIGMHVTEEAVVKVFDLLYNEYKFKWFQELKNIIVPDFHDAYRTLSMEVMPGSSRSREHKEHGKVRRSRSKAKQSRSILGF